MTDPIADLYVCWRCGNHDVRVDVGADPPEYHDCGYGPLQWSGHLHAYDPETGKFSRTHDEKPPRAVQHLRPGTQMTLPEGAYEHVGR